MRTALLVVAMVAVGCKATEGSSIDCAAGYEICVPSEDGGVAEYDIVCTDLKTDAKNCGACGVTCAPNDACEDGACKCVPKTCANVDGMFGQPLCGKWSDGCGGDLNCGTCSGGMTCGCPPGGTCDQGSICFKP